MKIKKVSTVKKDVDGNYFFSIVLGKGIGRKIDLSIDNDTVEKAHTEPINLDNSGYTDRWLYKNVLLKIESVGEILEEEEILKVKHFVLKEEKELNKITREVEAFENFDKTQVSRRERIPNNVRLFVWQRDEGKCVNCGNKEKLEFDHIIPVIEGGANTERNIQLLCESCNRSKGRSIGV